MRSTKIFTVSHNPSFHLPAFATFVNAGEVGTMEQPMRREVCGLEIVEWVTEADPDDQEEMNQIIDYMLDFLTPPFESPTTVYNSSLS